MEQVIQCPTCSKKYKLSGTPPPVFTCRSCNTQMDLSGFREPAAPPAVKPPKAVAPAAGGPQKRAAAPSGVAKSTRHRGAHAHARAGARRGHRPQEAEVVEDGEERPPLHHGSRGPNMGLILGSLGLLLVAGIGLLVVMSGREKPVEKAETAPVEPLPPSGPSSADLPDEVEEPKPAETSKRAPPVDVEDVRPELREGKLEALPVPEGKTKYAWNAARIQTYPYPDFVTPEERNQIDGWVHALVELGARDARDAQLELVKMDGYPKEGTEFKAVGRLISEFKNVADKYGMTTQDAMSRLMVIDRCLRKIDGMLERDFRDMEPININSSDREAERVIKKWNWWYDLEKWRLRRQPWDPKADMADDEEVDPDAE